MTNAALPTPVVASDTGAAHVAAHTELHRLLNQLPATYNVEGIKLGTAANRPLTPGAVNLAYYATDTKVWSQADSTTTWVDIPANLSTLATTMAGDWKFKSGRPWFDVTAFGADPTGATSSRAAAQAAYDACGAVFGGTVFWPRGLYRIMAGDAPIQVDGGTITLGDGAGTTNIQTRRTDHSLFECRSNPASSYVVAPAAFTNSVVFRNVQMGAEVITGGPTSGQLVHVQQGRTWLFDRVGFEQCNDAVVVVGSVNDVTFRNCMFSDVHSNAIRLAFDGRPAGSEKPNRVRIQGCDFNNIIQAAAVIRCAGVDRLSITNNTFTTIRQALSVSSTTGHEITDLIVQGNNVNGVAAVTEHLFDLNVRGCDFSGNIITGYTATDLTASAVVFVQGGVGTNTATLAPTLIHHNTIKGTVTGGHGIYSNASNTIIDHNRTDRDLVVGSLSASGCVFDTNTVIPTVGQTAAIYAAGNKTRIIDNVIINPGTSTGIYVIGSGATTADNVTVTGNIISGCGGYTGETRSWVIHMIQFTSGVSAQAICDHNTCKDGYIELESFTRSSISFNTVNHSDTTEPAIETGQTSAGTTIPSLIRCIGNDTSASSASGIARTIVLVGVNNIITNNIAGAITPGTTPVNANNILV